MNNVGVIEYTNYVPPTLPTMDIKC